MQLKDSSLSCNLLVVNCHIVQNIIYPIAFLVENAENVCDRCDKPFASSEGLKEHMTRHKEKPVAKRKVLSHLPIKKCKSDENSVLASLLHKTD